MKKFIAQLAPAHDSTPPNYALLYFTSLPSVESIETLVDGEGHFECTVNIQWLSEDTFMGIGDLEGDTSPSLCAPCIQCGYDSTPDDNANQPRTLNLILPPLSSEGNLRPSCFNPFLIHKDWLPLFRKAIRSWNNAIEPPAIVVDNSQTIE